MANQNSEKAYGVTNIKAHIPIVLDMIDHNYDPWCELMLTHCLSYDVLGHLDGSSLPANDNDLPWKKRDGLVKLWLYEIISKDIFTSCFKTGASSRQVWVAIKELFRGNKEAKAIRLDHDLCTKEIGDKSVHTHCQELKTIADLLSNVDAPVPSEPLLPICSMGSMISSTTSSTSSSTQPFPTFSQAREMLISEEERLGKMKKASSTHTDNSSSQT